MAKWGEGDPRWIVEERPDAVNVNNWHWVEKNATPWSKERLAELLLKKVIEQGPVKIAFKEFKKLEGDATANNRKAKLIFLYEWMVEISFSATIAGSDIEYKGYIEIPNFSDENDAYEIEINLNMDSKGPHDNEIRHIIHKDGLKLIREQVAIYLKQLKDEFSKDLILPTGASQKPQVIVKEKSTQDKKLFQNHVTVKESESKGAPTSVKSLTMTESFKAPPDRIFEILTNNELIRAWAGGNSTFEANTGGKFCLFGGAFSGSIISLVENKEIVENFRLKKFPCEYFAKAWFKLTDKVDCTDLTIEAEGIPEDLYDEVTNGFARYFFQTIGNTFNIGIKIF